MNTDFIVANALTTTTQDKRMKNIPSFLLSALVMFSIITFTALPAGAQQQNALFICHSYF